MCRGVSNCRKCERQRQYRQDNQLLYTYTTLKSNAKARGIPFNLTIKEWEEFCNRTSYLQFRGVMPDDFNVDRIVATDGYNANNIQVLTVSENARKSRKEKLQKYRKPNYDYDKAKKDAGTPF